MIHNLKIDRDAFVAIVDGRRTFRTHYYPVVKGDNGGITTTDPSNVSVKINNVAANLKTYIEEKQKEQTQIKELQTKRMD